MWYFYEGSQSEIYLLQNMDCGIDTYPLLTSRQDEIITLAKRRRARNIQIFESPEAYPLKPKHFCD